MFQVLILRASEQSLWVFMIHSDLEESTMINKIYVKFVTL